MTNAKTHLLILHSLLEQTRKECERYEDPLQIRVKIGGKVFMELSKAALSAVDLFSTIDYQAFEEAIKTDSSLEAVVSRGENSCH